MFRKRTWAFSMTAATMTFVVAVPGVASAYDPTGTEPTIPYAQPTDANVPKRGCQTIASNPASPPGGSTPAVQVIYAWHEAEGDRYEASVQEIAKIVDRIDWLIDESTNYDQHIKLSCQYTPNSTYSDYAHALVAKEKIEAGTNPSTSTWTVRDDLAAAGYDDSNRYYLVFTDFASGSDAIQCPTTGGLHCSAIVEHWDSGVAGHELIHVFGAGHTWATENDEAYWWDIMLVSWDIWLTDHGFNHYYDPSELSASFYIDAYPATVKVNIATHPAMTSPTCCDVGYSNDLLTAQERTIEANAPWSSPTGFSVSGAGWFQVTPPGSDSAVSARYYDGRRSLTMNVQSHGESVVAVTRKPAVTAGQKYRLFTYMTTNTSGNVKLRMAWYNSSNSLISTTDGALIGLGTTWQEYTLTATAPAGAASVQVQVVSPSGQNFAYLLDSLTLNHCNSPNTPEGCRMHITEL